tara:strand:+ start:1366 stop:1851 length:486 start_codon:yes stop_codon:yes gene_type:complete
MQTALAGTQEQEREYTFTTPLEHGLSYNRVNRNHPAVHHKIADCVEFVRQSILRANNEEYIKPEFLFNKFLTGFSDLWVSVEGQDIVGCLLIGVANYPEQTGIISESTGGKFHFETMMPALEDFYRKQGAKFVEIPGRKGWQRRFGPMGYTVKNVTITKRL